MMMDGHVVTPQEKEVQNREGEKDSSVPKEVNINSRESQTQCIEETQDKDDTTSYPIESELARHEIADNPKWQ
eukprot:15366616-Ditylum_brightwellii.AAC.4